MAKQIQKYMVLEKTNSSRNWDIVWFHDAPEQGFSTVEEATQALFDNIKEDPHTYADCDYKIAAINSEVIRVNIQSTFTLDVIKEKQ